MIIKFKLLSRTSKNVQMNLKGYSDAYFVLFLKISIINIYKRVSFYFIDEGTKTDVVRIDQPK